MKDKRLVCPYCNQYVDQPTAEGEIMICSEQGGKCAMTLYTLTYVQTGENLPEQGALRSLYKELTGKEWDSSDPDAPMVSYSRKGFLLPGGKVTEHLDDIPDGVLPQGVVFMQKT
jgi:hypothetical protein